VAGLNFLTGFCWVAAGVVAVLYLAWCTMTVSRRFHERKEMP